MRSHKDHTVTAVDAYMAARTMQVREETGQCAEMRSDGLCCVLDHNHAGSHRGWRSTFADTEFS